MYYNYHRTVKNKIKKGLLLNIEYLENYPNIGKVILLFFKDGTKYPIREERFADYFAFIAKHSQTSDTN